VVAGYSQGHLLFLRDGTLLAQPFDTGSLETRGEAAPVAEQVSTADYVGMWGVSQNGVLAYTSGATRNAQLTWFDRSGRRIGTVGSIGVGLSANPSGGARFAAALSPDGSTVAFDRSDKSGSNDVWLLDLARGGESRFTSGPGERWFPIWSPDGNRIAYSAFGESGNGLYTKSTRGERKEQVLDKSQEYP
jgi:eukaryotic-like serine/threonine-protein kinase